MPTRKNRRIARSGSGPAPADIEAAVAALGIEVGGADEYEVKGLCPMHIKRTGKQDRHPSWSVNRQTGLHNCFSCGYKGTFLQLVIDLRYPNDSWSAARWIRRFGIDFQAASDAIRIWDDLRETPEPESPDLDLAARLAMFDAPPEKALRKRGISMEAADYYGIRWDSKREAWILPIRRASDGAVLGWQFKSADGRFFRNFPLGVPKGETLFGYDVFPAGEADALVVESPLDVARIHTAGLLGGLSTYGAEWTEAQMQLVREATDTMISCFDNDKGGAAANKLLLEGDRRAGRRPWTDRIDLWFENYEGIPAKDPGDMSDRQILWSINNAKHWTGLVTARLQLVRGR